MQGGGGGGAVNQVKNTDGSLTISPTTGSVIASINTTHTNTFSANQVMGNFIVGCTNIQPPSTSAYIWANSSGQLVINGVNNSLALSVSGGVVAYFVAGGQNMSHGSILNVANLSSNDGSAYPGIWSLVGRMATSSTTIQNSGIMNYESFYWNGTTSIQYGFSIYAIQDSTSPSAHLSFNLNNNGTLTQIASLDNVGDFSLNGDINLSGGSYLNAGSGILINNTGICVNIPFTTLNGTTSGTAQYIQPFGGIVYTGNYRKVIIIFNSYYNTTSTAQTITFPQSFTNANVITGNTTGTSPTLSLTTLTLPINMSSTASGIIIIEGV